MNILILLRPKAAQMLILFVLVQIVLLLVFLLASIEPKNIWKTKNILRVWHESTNTNLNVFTRQLPLDDKKRLINLTNFDYKIKKEALCGKETVLLLIAISSAPGNQLQRNVIRETWGRSDDEVKIVFMLGNSNNLNDTKALETEDMNFHDIVQGNFLDSYKNMSYKSTMSLKYAIYNCPTAKFLMKCDDDILINIPLLKNFLKNDLSVINAKNSIFCNVNYARSPIRDPTGPVGKWYVSYEEWPEENFPLYCAGWYFIVALDVAFTIYRQAQNSTFFWIDDVFLSGIAARNVHGLKYVDISKFSLADVDYNNIVNGNLGDMPFLVGSMNMNPEQIQVLWQYVLARSPQESILNETNYSFLQADSTAIPD